MPLKIDPIAIDMQVLIRDELSPEAKSAAFAAFARQLIDETDAENDAKLAFDVQYDTWVDGARTGNLERVRPEGGSIIAEWQLIGEMFAWIAEQLEFMSPHLTGQYERNHKFFADGQEADPENPPSASEYFFANAVPYARKIERGLSSKAPDGVYQVVAEQAKQRFSRMAKIDFSYRSLITPYISLGGRSGGRSASASLRAANRLSIDTRQPAIIILPK